MLLSKEGVKEEEEEAEGVEGKSLLLLLLLRESNPTGFKARSRSADSTCASPQRCGMEARVALTLRHKEARH